MATFTSAIKTCIVTKPFNYRDRAPRSEFWFFYLFNFLLGLVSGIFALIPLINFLFFIFQFYLFLCTISAGVRRLHDINRTGHWMWLMCAPTLAAIFFFILALVTQTQAIAYLGYICLAIFVIGMIALFIFFCTKGTDGQNRFGPDPLVEEMQREAAVRMYMNGMAQNAAQQFGQQGPAPQGFGPQAQPGVDPNAQGAAPNAQGAAPNGAEANAQNASQEEPQKPNGAN